QGMHAIGEAVLPFQSTKEDLRVDYVRADVQLANAAHIGRSLFLFDDVHNLAARAADDPTVRQRMIHHRGEQSQMGLAEAVAIEQTEKGSGADEWCIAIEDQEVAAIVAKRLGRLRYRVAGAERRLLDD